MFRSPSSRITADKNEALRALDSMRTLRVPGLTILRGIPGSPAPEPTSARETNLGGSTLRNRRLSRKSFSTIQAVSEEPTKRWDFCHFWSSFRYLPNASSSPAVSGRPRMRTPPDASASSGDVKMRSLAVRRAPSRLVHVPLLEDLQDVGDGPVQHEACRKVEEHEREDERHHQHHLCLPRVASRRS